MITIKDPKQIEHLKGKNVIIEIATGEQFEAEYLGVDIDEDNPNDLKCEFDTKKPGRFKVKEIK